MDLNTQAVHHAQRMQQRETVQNRDDMARAFLASLKTADQEIKTAQTDKKQKEEDQKKRQRIFKKEDYEGYNELEDILSEIDERLEKMLDIAKQLDG